MPLNDRQMLFAREYALDPNGTQAAIRAGYSAKTAGQQAFLLLKNIEIQTQIARAREAMDKEYEHRVMGKYEVLARLTEIARGDIGDLLATDGEGNPIGDVESISLSTAKMQGKSKLIKKIRNRTTIVNQDGKESQIVEAEVEIYSAHDALRDLGKHWILFTDKVALTDKDGENITFNVVYHSKPKPETPEA